MGDPVVSSCPCQCYPIFLHDYLLLRAAKELKKRKIAFSLDVNSADHTPQEMWVHILYMLYMSQGSLVRRAPRGDWGAGGLNGIDAGGPPLQSAAQGSNYNHPHF